jgi:hypothetical protein
MIGIAKTCPPLSFSFSVSRPCLSVYSCSHVTLISIEVPRDIGTLIGRSTEDHKTQNTEHGLLHANGSVVDSTVYSRLFSPRIHRSTMSHSEAWVTASCSSPRASCPSLKSTWKTKIKPTRDVCAFWLLVSSLASAFCLLLLLLPASEPGY